MSGYVNNGLYPTGPAYGDLSGSFPNPTVSGIQTNPVDPRTPQNGDTLVYNGGEWIPTPSPSNTAALFKGTWDANANNPDLANYPGLSDGFTWIVITAGNTNLGGISSWLVGDYAIYSGGQWYKLSNSSFGWTLTGNAGTIPNVNYIGTSDPHDLSIRANAQEIIRVLVGGGINVTGPITATGDITGANISVDPGNKLKIYNDSRYTAFQSTIQSQDITYTLPSSYGGDNNYLVTNSSGELNWKSPVSIFAGSGLTGGGDISENITISMPNVGTAATYGSASQVPVLTTDAQGRVSNVTNTSISINASQITSGVLPVQYGGTSISSGNSGGIPYFNTTGSMASSDALTKSAITLGGGSGSAPYSLSSLGTASTVLHGNASGDPSFGAVSLTSDVSGILPIANGGTNLSSAGASGNILVSNGSAWASVPMTGNVSITSAGVTTVNAVQNVPVSSTAPSTNDVLQYNGTNWVPSSIISTLQTSYQTVRAQGNISAGDVCYIVNAGGSNPYPTVAKAQANSLSTIKGVIGLAIANIANNTIGTVQTYGQLIGPVNTQGFPQGAPLYVSATTAGGVTDVKPAGPNYTFQIGFVTRQGQPQNVTTGIVFVSPIMQTDTQNISDLVLTSQTEHDVLTYEASTSQWKNKQSLWVPNTQNSLPVDNGTIITAANFLNVVYLPIVTQGGANKTLNATTPIARLSKTNVDYGRELWLHNVDNSKSVTIPAGGSVLLDGGVNLVLAAGAIAKFVWTGIGGNGSWIQTSKVLTVA